MIIALVIFVLMYVGMLTMSKYRVLFAIGAAILMLIAGVLPIDHVPSAINWNVIMMIAGTMGIVSLFIESKMPARLADLILTKTPNVCTAVVALSVFAGIISAFVDNVATVLMIAPIGLAICKKMNMDPVPVIISIAVSSNLQGAATLVGDTTSILLGGYANMSFMDFIWWKGRPSIFWAVEVGALGTILILRWIFKDQKGAVEPGKITKVDDYVPGITLLSVIICLIAASFFSIPYIDGLKNGLICISICFIAMIRGCIKTKSMDPLRLVIKELDLTTPTLQLCCL